MSVVVTPDPQLAQWHTFGLPAIADALIEVHSLAELIEAYQLPQFAEKPKLILGGGSNVVFTEDFAGLVIVNRIMQRQVTEQSDSWSLHLGAGENWDEVVRWCIEQSYFGLENLALIPGTVGASPIQNIGAYGVEMSDFCDYVEYLDLDTMEPVRIEAAECQFGYRDSVFKQRLAGKAVIIAVGLRLPKVWQPVLEYGPLQQLKQQAELTAHTIYQQVVAVRQSKLPDPQVLGNAGSFFKNPLISNSQYQELLQQYPELPGYSDGDQVKVPAGWLIDRCGLKGFAIGGAAVHQQQALVLVNTGAATATDLRSLANHVIATVKAKFDIGLHPEVRVVNGQGQLEWRDDQ
ncbi:UDP-N-acetylmuramate dehydrogenase [Ferrimonas senticii]|uniref:UDP-N-acetylmuramate dehydrogenase n=1 Tax=Ferrimonas senticii TaxID=394566 RepID=UPI0003F6E278|nr:UDP-N-acetylmuramate dehydrogenase [Ferrimonas senticii]